jgi:ABC-type dipeptide/oligopeptide/nickel transport system permease subunit
MNLFSHSERTEWLLLAWADKHPYLFTFIEVTSPTLIIVLVVAGFNMVNGVLRGGKRWQKR